MVYNDSAVDKFSPLAMLLLSIENQDLKKPGFQLSQSPWDFLVLKEALQVLLVVYQPNLEDRI
ncbi:MAG: hypothetical protein ACRYFB_05055 [Janthinobacterium lividum]